MFGDIKRKKDEIVERLGSIDRLEEVGSLPTKLQVKRLSHKGKFETLIRREEISLRQKKMKIYLNDWNLTVFGDIKRRKVEILERLRSIYKLEEVWSLPS